MAHNPDERPDTGLRGLKRPLWGVGSDTPIRVQPWDNCTIMAQPCENQVRRMAGIVITIGTALAYFVSPLFLIIPAFAGLNLLQSSFSNVCPAEWMMPACGTSETEQHPTAPAQDASE